MSQEGTRHVVEVASQPGENLEQGTLPSRSSGAPISNASPNDSVGEWDPTKVRACPNRCEFMVNMDPEGAPRHQCPNPPIILMELDLGVAPLYRWACTLHANERVVPLKAMIVRRFRGQE